MTKIKKIYYVVITTITVVFFALAAYILVGALVGRANNRAFSYFGHSFHYVTSDSMMPDIAVGDIVIARKIAIASVKVGDDVLYIAPSGEKKGEEILHRVKSINGDGSLVTRAIKAGATDDPYNVKEIVGVRVNTSQVLGKMYYMCTTPSGIMTIGIVLIAVVVIGKCLINIAGGGKKDDAIEPPDVVENNDNA